MSILTVESLFVYPIKSCRGTALQRVNIDNFGFENDRKWMVIDENGKFLTQREAPELALIQTEITNDSIRISYLNNSIKLSLSENNIHHFYTTVWESEPLSVADEGNLVATFFSDILHRKCRLVKRSETYKREVSSGKIIGKHHVGFVDSHPILIITKSSLKELNQRLAEQLPFDRFRPNIIVSGECKGFHEDDWMEIEINNQVFDFGKRCSRCTITTIDQVTLEKGKEPLSELAQFRRDNRGKVCFGSYFTNRYSIGIIEVGNYVTILQSENKPLNESIN